MKTDTDIFFLITKCHIRKTTTLTAFREKHCDICDCTPWSFKWDGPIVNSAARKLIWHINEKNPRHIYKCVTDIVLHVSTEISVEELMFVMTM